jgi:hypothetical protein
MHTDQKKKFNLYTTSCSVDTSNANVVMWWTLSERFVAIELVLMVV